MNLKHHLQTAGLARVPVSLVAFAAVGLLSIAPAALAADNGWGTKDNGYGYYHESNGAATGWNTSTNTEDRYFQSNGSTGSGNTTAGSQTQTQ